MTELSLALVGMACILMPVAIGVLWDALRSRFDRDRPGV